jgi:hypothetical protein
MVAWILNGLLQSVGTVSALILKIIGWVMIHALVHPLLSYVVAPLLQATVFDPTSLTGHGIVAQAAGNLWRLWAAVSGAVALFGGAWGVFTQALSTLEERPRDSRAYLEAGSVYLAVLVGGYGFLSSLLSIADAVTRELVTASFSIGALTGNAALGVASGAAGVVATLCWPSSLLVLAGFLLWAVVVWVMRQVDLVFYVGLLPVTAALTFTGNKAAFEWNWNEAVGAVLSQMAMAIAWWVAWALLGGTFVPSGQVTATSFSEDFLHLLLGIGALTLVARAPSMLQQVTGHRSAGVAGLALGVAAGGVLSREARSAALMSPAGAAVSQIGRAAQLRAENVAGSWADGKTMGERLGGTRTGKALTGFAVRAAGAAGAALAESPPVRAAGAAASAVAQGVRGVHAWAEGHAPALADAMDLGGEAAAGVGRAAYGAATEVARAAQTAGSMAVEPRLTLGRHLEAAYGAQGQAGWEVTGRRTTARAAMPMGTPGAAESERIKQEQVEGRVNRTKPEGADVHPIMQRLHRQREDAQHRTPSRELVRWD